MAGHPKSRLAVLVTLAAAAALAAPLWAAEGRIPIFAPTTIVTNGKYIVTRNISSPTSSCITVLSPNVDIDLNGFTLDTAGAPFDVISVPAAGFESLTVRNGILRGGSSGINVGPSLANGVFENLKIQSPTVWGIHLINPLSVTIRRNDINGVSGDSVLIDPGGSMTTGTIEGNVIRDGTGAGISVNTASALAILHNRVEGVGGIGILLLGSEGCLLSENTVERVSNDGIFLLNSNGNKLFDNVVRAGKSHGIHIDGASASNLVVLNSATGNGGAGGVPGHGLLVEGAKNVLERNVLNDNTGAGLYLSGPASILNTFSKNTARGNLGFGLGVCFVLFPPNSCDTGGGNTTFGDNLIPGPPVF